MSESQPLFPDPPRHSGRYTVRPESERPWGMMEQMLLFPVLGACRNRFAYHEACVWLCRILDRSPTFPATARPTKNQIAIESRSIIERRTVTGLLVHTPKGGKAWDQGVSINWRSERDLTWAEKDRIIEPWFKKRLERTPWIEEQELADLMGRSVEPERNVLGDYISELVHGHKLGIAEEEPGEGPGGRNNYAELIARVLFLVKAEREGRTQQYPGLWQDLIRFLFRDFPKRED